MDRQHVAVLEREHDGRVRNEVLEPVSRQQAELVGTDQRIGLQDDVCTRARVVLPAGQRELLGDGVAADDVAALEDEDLDPGLSQIGRTHQGVVACADDDDVGLGGCHGYLSPSRGGIVTVGINATDCKRLEQSNRTAAADFERDRHG